MKALISAAGNTALGTAPRELELDIQHQGLLEDKGLREEVRNQLEHHFASEWQMVATITFDDELLAFQ